MNQPQPLPSGPGYKEHPNHKLDLLPCQKRVRVKIGSRTVADSSRALLMLESRHHPVYYFPAQDVDQSLLIPTDHESYCPFKGQASYWSIAVGERRSENAVWGYRAPYNEVAALTDHVAFYWDRVDQWFEEDEEIFVHVRNPHVRIDILSSNRPVRIIIAGETIAETRRALYLFETGLPARYYIPMEDIRMDLLKDSKTRTACPYKGSARHWHYSSNNHNIDDVAWSYPDPFPEVSRIRNLLCFYPDRVDAVYVDEQRT